MTSRDLLSSSDAPLAQVLHSGEILCDVANSVRPGIVKKVHRDTPLAFKHMENIENYQRACVSFGVPAEEMFNTIDLYEFKNFSNVLANIYQMAKHASSLPGYDGPVVPQSRGGATSSFMTPTKLQPSSSPSTTPSSSTEGTPTNTTVHVAAQKWSRGRSSSSPTSPVSPSPSSSSPSSSSLSSSPSSSNNSSSTTVTTRPHHSPSVSSSIGSSYLRAISIGTRGAPTPLSHTSPSSPPPSSSNNVTSSISPKSISSSPISSSSTISSSKSASFSSSSPPTIKSPKSQSPSGTSPKHKAMKGPLHNQRQASYETAAASSTTIHSAPTTPAFRLGSKPSSSSPSSSPGKNRVVLSRSRSFGKEGMMEKKELMRRPSWRFSKKAAEPMSQEEANDILTRRARAPSVTTLESDVMTKRQFKCDPAQEKAAREWIENVLKITLPHGSLEHSLRDGVLLCRVINEIKPGMITKIHTPKHGTVAFRYMENIEQYLGACTRLGMNDTDLFSTIDLFQGKDFNAVLANIYVLAKHAVKRLAYKGPSITKAEKDKDSGIWKSLLHIEMSSDKGGADTSLAAKGEGDHDELITWVNLKLEPLRTAGLQKRGVKVASLSRDFKDGTALLNLIECITRQPVGIFTKNPTISWHYMQNITLALRFISSNSTDSHHVLTSISGADIFAGNREKTSALLRYIMHNFDRTYLYRAMPEDTRRRKVAEELLFTEQTYVTNLGCLVKDVISPLRDLIASSSSSSITTNTSNQSTTMEQLSLAFSNWSDIFSLHTSLLQIMKMKFAEDIKIATFGDLFLDAADLLLPVYTKYVNTFEQCGMRAKFLRKTNSSFNELLTRFEEDRDRAAGGGLDLASFLIMPVQRMPRYLLLLRELLKCTPSTHLDANLIQEGCKAIEKVVLQINASKAHHNNMSRLLAIAQSMYFADEEDREAFNSTLPPSLLQQMESGGGVTVVIQSTGDSDVGAAAGGGEGDYLEYVHEGFLRIDDDTYGEWLTYFFLMEDRLIMTKYSQKHSPQEFKYKETFMLYDIIDVAGDIRDNDDGEEDEQVDDVDDLSSSSKFALVTSDFRLILQAENEADKYVWISKIQACVDKLPQQDEDEGEGEDEGKDDGEEGDDEEHDSNHDHEKNSDGDSD
eukprot:TRINITY_DN4247_c0_g1_i5.p1 TRINITY_DN4247_c0_g1~~TRINITY_DN4247_c0_g1_i5.p1  ORF type:complete len:1216 (+),score=317.57 TRINITY_DN4247_c0_g1_i5:241-3648(+)